MMKDGWIKLYRNVTNWRLYENDFMFKFFVTLLANANVYEKKWNGTTIKRGQILTSISHLSRQFNKTPRQIRTALENMDGEEIEITTTNRFTIISIKNYEAYQNCACSQSEKGTQRARQNESLNNSYFDNYANNNSDEETEEGRQRADKGQTKGRQRALTKEYKNKEYKKEEEISTNVDKEKKLSADAEIFSDEKDSGNNAQLIPEEKEKEKKVAPKRESRFVPPTLEEVKDYEAQKGYTFSAEKFWGYYESNGWRVGKNPMKSWHGACVTWQGKQNEESNNLNLNSNGINTQRPESRFERREREEREYLEKMERLSRSFIEHPGTETKLNFGDENT